MAAGGPRFTPPESVEEYRLLRPLGQGAMGQVYLAHDRLLDRKVAVKFIAAVDPSAAAREQFFTEARAIARLSHPNVVVIYRVGEITRRPYLVSEYLDGQGLDEAPRPMPWERVVAIGVGLARGLAAAHRHGVLHRDIKPANAKLTADGDVKLLDFGLAKLLQPTMTPMTVERLDPGAALAPTRDAMPAQRDAGTGAARPEPPSPVSSAVKSAAPDARSDAEEALARTSDAGLALRPTTAAPLVTDADALARTSDAGLALHPTPAGPVTTSGTSTGDDALARTSDAGLVLRVAPTGNRPAAAALQRPEPALSQTSDAALAPLRGTADPAPVHRPRWARGATPAPPAAPTGDDDPALAETGASPWRPREAGILDLLQATPTSTPGFEALAPPTGRATAEAPAEVVGSPLYMAPELWLGEPASVRSDLYALGTLLYELLAGRAPFWDCTILDLPRTVGERDAAPLAERAPDCNPRLCAIIDRCLRRDPAERYASAADLREALEALQESGDDRAIPEGNPYRGLLAFEESERGVFFGRDAEVRAVMERLRGEPFVLVAGDSGVGKSSLCRAGVLGAVSAGALGPQVAVARMLPGRRPLLALFGALSALPQLAGWDDAALMARLHDEPAALALELRRRFTGRAGRGLVGADGDHLLLFVDQLEELLTQAEPAEARLFSEALGAVVAAAPGVRLLASARSDFLTRLSGLPGLGPPLPRALHLISPLSEDGLRQAVVQPALAKGFRFETPALVDALVAAATEEGGLPLLQFALSALWEARDEARRLIPAAALAALGGVSGALAEHADRVFFGLPPPEQRAARRLLSRLVSVEGLRLRQPERALCDQGEDTTADRAALDALVRGRLVLVRADETGESQYELAHEALLSGWGTLRGLLRSDAELRLQLQRISQAAAEWERLARAPELLFGERQLQQVTIEPGSEAFAALPGPERAFLDASRRAQRRRRQARVVVGVGVLLSLCSIYGALRLSAHLATQRRVRAALARVDDALRAAREIDARRRAEAAATFAAFSAREPERAEASWERALSATEAESARYREAAQALEMALALDPGDPGLSRRFAAVLAEWSQLAEESYDRARRDDLQTRLRLYDHDGSEQRRLSSPARLSLSTSPPGAEAQLAHVHEAPQSKRLVEGEARPLGQTPLVDRALAAGSYVLILRAPGRAPVRAAILLRRGEDLRMDIPLPRPDAIPAGMVYIPAGRFLFGSDRPEDLRRTFYGTAPLFEARTDAYLIAAHEATYADWLTYLRALPSAERLLRAPHMGGMQGSVTLSEGKDGLFELSLRPSGLEYRAREGELLRYGHRDRRAAVDWRRLPVTGVNFADAQAYAAWLAASGRVPGARLCTELEWERAARGADNRHFPHGDRIEKDDANLVSTYDKDPAAIGPDEVGAHPASRSPFGVDDLIGNAFEWVLPSISKQPAMVRGGSYYYGERTSNTISRQEPSPTYRDATVGFRICSTPVP